MRGRVEPLIHGGLNALSVHSDDLVAATRSVADLTGARAIVGAVVGADGQRLVELERGQAVASARGVCGRQQISDGADRRGRGLHGRLGGGSERTRADALVDLFDFELDALGGRFTRLSWRTGFDRSTRLDRCDRRARLGLGDRLSRLTWSDRLDRLARLDCLVARHDRRVIDARAVASGALSERARRAQDG